MVNGLSISGDKVRFFLDNHKFVMNSTMPNGMEISGSNLVIKSDINIEGNIQNTKLQDLESNVLSILNGTTIINSDSSGSGSGSGSGSFYNNSPISNDAILTSNNDASFGNVAIAGNLQAVRH